MVDLENNRISQFEQVFSPKSDLLSVLLPYLLEDPKTMIAFQTVKKKYKC